MCGNIEVDAQSPDMDRADDAEERAPLLAALVLGICHERFQLGGRMPNMAWQDTLSAKHARSQSPLAPRTLAKLAVDLVTSRQQRK